MSHFSKRIFLILACLFFSVLGPSLAHAAATFNVSTNSLGMVAYWSMDGKTISGTSLADQSGNGNTGTLVDGPTPTRGKIGQALQFNGVNQTVTIPSFSIANSITVSAWINTSAPTQSGGIVGRGINTDWELFFETNGLKWRGGDTLNQLLCTPPSANAWHHVVATQTGTNSVMYIDGVPCSSNSGTTAITNGGGKIVIGSLDNALYYFQGSIDDVRIYNRALSPAEVATLYQQTEGSRLNTTSSPGTLGKGLAAYYSFDGTDISGTTVTDLSGNGNNGTLVDSPPSALGKIGQAISFDGVDDGTGQWMTSGASVGSTYTFSAWVKAAAFSGEQGIFAVNGGQTFYLASGNPFLYDGGYLNTPSHALSLNTWYLLTLVNNTSNSFIYVNGVLISTATADTNTWSNIAIGKDTVVDTFDGAIDDARIYSRALSANEVMQLYNLGTGTHVNTSTTPNGSLSQGLVGYWTFDGNTISGTTVSDMSGKGYTGALDNSPALTIGKLGQAVKFSGYQQVEVDSAPATDAMANFTISLWANIRMTTGDALYIYDKELTDFITINSIGFNQLGLELDIPFSTTHAHYATNDIKSLVENGGWHLFTVVYTGSSNSAKIYIDGVETGGVGYSTQTPGVGTRTNDTGRIFIGDDGYDSTALNGSAVYDDYRIYNRVLSASEIQQLYNMGK